ADLHVHPDGYRVGEGRLISAQYPLLRAIEAAEAVHAQDGETVVIDVHGAIPAPRRSRSEEHTSELQSRENLVCRLLREKKRTHPNFMRIIETTTRFTTLSWYNSVTKACFQCSRGSIA